MKFLSGSLALLVVLLHVQLVRADFVGSNMAQHALSPNGRLLVRIKTAERDEASKERPKYEVTYYEFDAVKDSYERQSSFPFSGNLSQMLYVSDAGELMMISLGEKDAVRLYSKTGELIQSWNLQDFLTPNEIKACAATGSTLQWFEEGAFIDRRFHFRGPSRLIRALQPPYTVMRSVNHNVTFSGSINLDTVKLNKDRTR